MFQPTPITRQAESLAELVQQAKAFGREAEMHESRGATARKCQGERLLRCRELVAHGDWLGFLAENFPNLPPRTAQRWMDLARPKSATSDKPSGENANLAHGADDGTPESATQSQLDAGVTDSGTLESAAGVPPECRDSGPVPRQPEHYADVARGMVADLRRVRRKVAAILDGPCGDAAREYLRRHGRAGWEETGESERDREVMGVDLLYRVYQCEAYLALVDDAAGLAGWLGSEEGRKALEGEK